MTYREYTECYSISFLFLLFFHQSSLYPINIFAKCFYLLVIIGMGLVRIYTVSLVSNGAFCVFSTSSLLHDCITQILRQNLLSEITVAISCRDAGG